MDNNDNNTIIVDMGSDDNTMNIIDITEDSRQSPPVTKKVHFDGLLEEQVLSNTIENLFEESRKEKPNLTTENADEKTNTQKLTDILSNKYIYPTVIFSGEIIVLLSVLFSNISKRPG